MKTVLLTLFLLCTATAFGQATLSASPLSNQAQPLVMQDHPEHASQKPMAVEQNLLQSSEVVSFHGERPLWEFSQPAVETPLGDSARLLRKEHASAKKATRLWHN